MVYCLRPSVCRSHMMAMNSRILTWSAPSDLTSSKLCLRQVVNTLEAEL